ncbi:MAG: amidohydrolase [Puniceicoccaceae bacterium]|nr:MAG: amidohydrolase [Puniceicoccaceae bacterium]
MIIDCHTHAYPPEAVERPHEWAMARGETHWAELVAPTDRTSIQGWSDPATMLGAMDAAGVDRAVLLGWYWQQAATCQWHNAVMAEWMRFAPDRFLAFASIYPDSTVLEQLKNAQSLGFCGVGEIHLGVQPWDISSDVWQTLAEWCTAQAWPINFHVTEAAGHPQAESVATPLQTFIDIARKTPELKMILAHWGGGLPFFALNPKLKPVLRNVYFDTAASPLLYDMTIFRQVIQLVGPEHVLYGSDYPLRLYPREQKLPDMQRFVTAIQHDAQLSPEECKWILGGNFARLPGGQSC